MVKEQGELFIFNDDDGCVMLILDDEEGVLVWFMVSLVSMWVDQEWVYCEFKVISFDVWLFCWIFGLFKDFFNVIIVFMLVEESELMVLEDFVDKLV